MTEPVHKHNCQFTDRSCFEEPEVDSDPPTFADPMAGYNWLASEGRAPKCPL